MAVFMHIGVLESSVFVQSSRAAACPAGVSCSSLARSLALLGLVVSE